MIHICVVSLLIMSIEYLDTWALCNKYIFLSYLYLSSNELLLSSDHALIKAYYI